jgi:hypothetical protein
LLTWCAGWAGDGSALNSGWGEGGEGGKAGETDLSQKRTDNPRRIILRSPPPPPPPPPHTKAREEEPKEKFKEELTDVDVR